MSEGLASSHITRAVLNIGAVFSAACFLVAVVLEWVGRPLTTGDAFDVAGVTSAVLEASPWGWATLGVVGVLLTPVAGLITTAVEYRGGRETWLAMGVLVILAVSLAIALAR